MRRNTADTVIAGKYLIAENGCWLWRRCRDKLGYGRVKWMGRNVYAHRASYELVHGPIPANMDLDHVVCNNPNCINPSHLAPTSHRANVMRGNGACAQNARKTSCKQGHPLTLTKQGNRRCLECYREYQREYHRAWRTNANAI